MKLERISPGVWTQDGKEMSQSDWDKVPYDIVMRAYSLESPIIFTEETK